ncbi:MAG TPA: SDR family NAD(P)-dependent oxidoreductase [Actinomycetota bacterium]|nr:SDR family NAD(P)-dependent oxidoreductase [Actinomycetota bacterium]
MNWKGKVCVITGASSGFGESVARELASRGARIIAVARREEKLREIIDDVGGAPHSYIKADISDLAQVRAMATRLAQLTDHVDVLINNAGVGTSGPLAQATSEELEGVIRTNLLGAIWCTKESLALIEKAPRERRTPIVVNVASMAGRIALPGSADYAASKFGLVGFTESIWYELSAKGIRTMMVNPGLADTEGFPMDAIRAKPLLGWSVMDASRVAGALVRGIEQGSFEVRVQWWMNPIYYLVLVMGPLRRTVVGALRRSVGNVGKF